jgi:hypothetical protein
VHTRPHRPSGGKLGFHALKGEQRKIGGDYDQRREEDRLRNLQRSFAHVRFTERFVRFRLAPAPDDFDHNNRGVHDDPEVDRA